MTHSEEGSSIIEPPVVSNPLFFLDYDGTLAPIVQDPAAAYPHPDVPGLLDRLGERHPVVVVTGRHLRDIETFLPNLNVQAIGLHGAQEGRLGTSIESRMPEEARSMLQELRERVPEGDGIWVEDKEYTFAVHYRNAADHDEARAKLRAWARAVPDALHQTWGKCVVELRPVGLSKGTAVRDVAGRYPERTPLYLGDDVTDEDAFEALADDGVTIKVGDGATKARYRLGGVPDVAAYLERYLTEQDLPA